MHELERFNLKVKELSNLEGPRLVEKMKKVPLHLESGDKGGWVH
jgi:hypothetical protein